VSLVIWGRHPTSPVVYGSLSSRFVSCFSVFRCSFVRLSFSPF
jgi:hypothetical protein